MSKDNAYTIEMNNARPVNTSTMNGEAKRRYTEVCKALVYGKDTPAELNFLKDNVAKFLKEKSAAASNGDYSAMSEVNSVVTLLVEPAVLQATTQWGLVGNYHELAYNETAEVETWKLVGGESRRQAYNGDVNFGSWEYSKYPVSTITISGGTQVDYRELSMGNFDSKLPQQIQLVTTDINNKSMAYIMDNVFAALANNSDYVKFYTEYSGTITQVAVDNMINNIARINGGKVSIIGDRSIMTTISGWLGYKSPAANTYTPFYTEQMVTEMNNNGYLGTYKTTNLVALPNTYNLTKPKSDKTAFDTYYETDRVLVLPVGMNSPVNIFRRGGMTTMVGSDVKTGRYLTRYDTEIGVDVVKGNEYMVGALSHALT